MHDGKLEERLREVLRAEGDSIPLTLTADQLQLRLRLWRSERANRRFGLAAAAAVVVALAAAGGFLFSNRSDTPPVGASATPAASGTPPAIPASWLDGLAPNDAITVRYLAPATAGGPGDVVIEATRLDGATIAGGLTTVEKARIPASIWPAGFGPSDMGGATFSPIGWLALPVQGGTADQPVYDLVIFDLREGGAPPWIVENASEAYFGPDGRLAVRTDGGVRIADPATQTLTSIAAPAGTDLSWTWAADGSGVLAIVAEPQGWGIVDATGSLERSSGLPALYQRTGTERPAAADGRVVGQGCDSGGAPGSGGCVLSVGDVNWLHEADRGIPSGWAWNASGTGLYAVFQPASSASAVADIRLELLTGPGASQGIASGKLESNATLRPIGITGESNPDVANHIFLVGGEGSLTYLAFSGAGAWVEFSGVTFAGWGAEQPAYPAP